MYLWQWQLGSTGIHKYKYINIQIHRYKFCGLICIWLHHHHHGSSSKPIKRNQRVSNFGEEKNLLTAAEWLQFLIKVLRLKSGTNELNWSKTHHTSHIRSRKFCKYRTLQLATYHTGFTTLPS